METGDVVPACRLGTGNTARQRRALPIWYSALGVVPDGAGGLACLEVSDREPECHLGKENKPS